MEIQTDIPVGLKEALRVWTQNALLFLSGQAQSGRQIPEFEKTEFIHSDEHQSILESKVTKLPDVYTFIDEHGKSLELLEGYTSVSDSLNCSQTISSHLMHLLGTEKRVHAIDVEYLLHQFLAKVWWRSRQFTFKEEEFESVYNSFIELFLSPVIKAHLITPILSFISEGDIKFSSDIRIRTLGEEEFDRFYVLSEAFRRQFGFRFKNSKIFVFESEIAIEKPYQDMEAAKRNQSNRQLYIKVDVESGKRTIEDVRSVLHIFKGGFFRSELILVEIASGWGAMSTFPLNDVDRDASPYQLSKEEINELQNLWRIYTEPGWRKHKFLRIAIDRLSYGVMRSRSDDSIIDYVIGLEALLLHDLSPGDRGELRNRFALRGARLLADTLEERKRNFNELKTAYDVRSSIVHGAATISLRKTHNTPTLDEFAESVAAYVRVLIKKFLEYSISDGPKLVDWDQVMLS
jgi:Apea-like HEPN